MSVVEKLFESTATHGKPLFIALLTTIFILLVVLLIFAKKCKRIKEADFERSPYKHWNEIFEDDAYWYALPTRTKLFNQNLELFGTVANNLNYFLKDSSLEKVVEDYFYGNLDHRSALWVKIVSIDTSSNYMIIETITGKKFIIQKPHNVALRVNLPKAPSNSKKQ